MKKIEITVNQAVQFNSMLDALKRITKYQTPDQLRRGSKGDYGLDYTEALEMAYENIQGTAKYGSKGIKPIPDLIDKLKDNER